MERVEARITLDLFAIQLFVYPLDATGSRLDPLPASEVERVAEGFRFRLNAPGQPPAPWYEVVAEPPPVPRRRAR